jgi:glycosyltransferase involved in cell wall biosynthesis
MPNALLEAMATGLPAVVTDVGDCRQAVGDAGWVVDPQDPEAIARALVILSSTPVEERARLADRARQHIIDNFGVRRARDAYRALWRPEETDLER